MATVDRFRSARWLRTFNLVLQAVLFFTFFAQLNYLARSHPLRFDLTQHRRYSLSPETLSWVQHLPRPVRIVVTIPEDDNSNPEVRGLLSEYRHATEASHDGPIKIEYVDVDLNRRKAEELGVEQPNAIALICGERRHVMLVDELYVIKNKERAAFQGEQVLTAAILDVSNPERQKIYFLAGHAELRLDDTARDRGLSGLRDQLRVRNFEVDTIDLTVARKIPADASLLVAVWPQSRATPAEQELLRQYLSAGAGRLILLLAPGVSASALGLEDLLLDWGVLVDDDVIFDTGAENVTDDGDLIIRSYDPTQPIVQAVLNNKVWLRFGATRSVRPDPGRALGSGLNIVALIGTSKTAWGERDYRAGVMPRPDPTDIHPLPGIEPKDSLGLAVASERVAVRDNLPFSVRGGRLVVFGTGDLVTNARLTLAGNFDVFLGAVNWTTDRDNQLKIPSRPIERFQLSLSAGELLNLRYTLLLALPGVAAALGLLVYWTRRR